MNENQKGTIHTLLNLYNWHSKMFKNALDGIADKDAENRLNSKANHIKWIAGSLVHQRFEMGKVFGLEMQDAGFDLFRDFKGIVENAAYPALDTYRADWEKISPVLADKLANISEAQFNGPDPFQMPGGDFRFSDSILFMIDRESYCIGQIGLFRRLLGYDAMKFE